MENTASSRIKIIPLPADSSKSADRFFLQQDMHLEKYEIVYAKSHSYKVPMQKSIC
jgi:hypothetical protein